MRDRIEVAGQVSINHIGVAPADQPVHFLDRIHRPTCGAIAVGIVLEVGLEDRLQHEFCGGLHDPIPNGRHTPSELHLDPTNLWDRLRSSIRSIRCADSGLSF